MDNVVKRPVRYFSGTNQVAEVYNPDTVTAEQMDWTPEDDKKFDEIKAILLDLQNLQPERYTNEKIELEMAKCSHLTIDELDDKLNGWKSRHSRVKNALVSGTSATSSPQKEPKKSKEEEGTYAQMAEKRDTVLDIGGFTNLYPPLEGPKSTAKSDLEKHLATLSQHQELVSRGKIAEGPKCVECGRPFEGNRKPHSIYPNLCITDGNAKHEREQKLKAMREKQWQIEQRQRQQEAIAAIKRATPWINWIMMNSEEEAKMLEKLMRDPEYAKLLQK